MKLENKDGLRILYPEEGLVIIKKDRTAIIDGEVYLGKFDSEDNYSEVSQEDAAALRVELSKQKEEFLKNNEKNN